MILLYKFKGTHPKTKREWRFIQGINMNYVPRQIRKRFIINWKKSLLKNNGNVLLTWKKIKSSYPGLAKSSAIRRYFYSPNYYITKAVYIPIDDMEDALISSWHKDFSKKVKRAITRKFVKSNKKRKKRTKEDIITRSLKSIFGKK